jgi:hypothetical protein
LLEKDALGFEKELSLPSPHFLKILPSQPSGKLERATKKQSDHCTHS